MSIELTRSLTEKAERGDWRGADALMAAAVAEVESSGGRRAPKTRRRPSWALAPVAALVVVIAIGLPVLLLRGGTDVAGEGTTTSSPSTTEAPATTLPPATTVAPVATTATTLPGQQGPMIWTRISIGGPNDEVFALTADDGGLIAVGVADGAPAVWISDDGWTWAQIADDELRFEGGGWSEVVDLVSRAGGYAAIGADGSTGISAWTSPDGRIWTRRSVDAFGPGELGGVEINAMADGPAGLVAVGWGTRSDESETLTPIAVRSGDGVTWERGDTSGLASGGMKAVTAGGPGYVAVGIDWSSSGTAGVWTSPDGLVWTQADPAGVEPIPAQSDIYEMESVIASDDGRLHAFGSGSAWTSADGLAWSWQASYAGDPEADFGTAWAGWPIAASATGGRVVVAGALEFRLGAEPDRAAAWASADGGGTWQRMAQPLEVFGDRTGMMYDLAELDGLYVAIGVVNGEPAAWAGVWNEEAGS